MNQELKKKGNALMEKKLAEQERQIEEEVARKAVELEAELEATMTPDELKKMRQQQIEDADHALTDDLFGSIDNKPKGAKAGAGSGSDVLVLKDLKDHLKHAKKIGAAIKEHGKIHLTSAFLKEVITECKDVLDDAAISDIIKTCSVIKNDMVQAAKRKVKYQAQKAKKVDKCRV
ncbi:Translation initiation factor eIF3 subunit [Fragilaria crotonensis]|nr:Translation initiation factor eIF3 subunit [Fragilaria crotonensis]